MFKVRCISNRQVFTVYAVSGTRFLIWTGDAGDENWEWHEMDRFEPLEVAE